MRGEGASGRGGGAGGVGGREAGGATDGIGSANGEAETGAAACGGGAVGGRAGGAGGVGGAAVGVVGDVGATVGLETGVGIAGRGGRGARTGALTAGGAGAASTAGWAAGGRTGGTAGACCLRMALRTSPGREICERSIFVLISSLAVRLRRAVLLAVGASPAAAWKCTRTFSASWSSSELEWVFFSLTPTTGSTSRIALLLTSSSLARSLIRILLILLSVPPPCSAKSTCQPHGFFLPQ